MKTFRNFSKENINGRRFLSKSTSGSFLCWAFVQRWRCKLRLWEGGSDQLLKVQFTLGEKVPEVYTVLVWGGPVYIWIFWKGYQIACPNNSSSKKKGRVNKSPASPRTGSRRFKKNSAGKTLNSHCQSKLTILILVDQPCMETCCVR